MDQTFVFMGDESVKEPLVKKLLEAGYREADSLTTADLVITYFISLTDLEDAYFDSEGIIQHAQKGAILIDLSAATPDFARELNAVALVSELHAIEAPLSVKDIALENAFEVQDNVFSFLAGEESIIKKIQPILDVLVRSHEFVGSTGSAQLAKAMSTLQSVSSLVSLIEADALFRATNLPETASAQVVFEKGLASYRAKQLFEAIKRRSFSGTFTVHMCAAELSAALMAADDADIILPSAEACMHLLELLVVIGGSRMNPTTLSLIYDDEEACAKQGLDWTRAEQAYGQEEVAPLDGDEYDQPSEDYPGGFGSYSTN